MIVEKEYFTNGYITYYTQNTSNVICESWILLDGENLWNRYFRIFLYLFSIVYTFVGVSIAADMFMNSIERITSTKRSIKVYNEKTKKVEEREIFIWNQTVANLTLMAFGSSAPEILLSTIEACFKLSTIGKVEKPKDSLGLFTILGSAAFNLFMISCVSIISVRSDQIKKIEDFGVFMITSIWSMLAYVWMLIVAVFISPGVIEIWEALLTLFFFPFLVFMAYGQSNKWWKIHKRILAKCGHSTLRRRRDLRLASNENVESPLYTRKKTSFYLEYPVHVELGNQRLSIQSQIELDTYFHRGVNSQEDLNKRTSFSQEICSEPNKVFFPRNIVKVSKEAFKVKIPIKYQRSTRFSHSSLESADSFYHVNYQTRDGDAKSLIHYKPVSGSFKIPMLAESFNHDVEIDLFPNDGFKENMLEFYIFIDSDTNKDIIGSNSICRISIYYLDENIFYLESGHFYGSEETNDVKVVIHRSGTANISTKIRLQTQDGTAKGGPDTNIEGVDYKTVNKIVEFEAGQSTAVESIPINYVSGTYKSFVVTLRDLPKGSKFGERAGAVCYLSYIIESEIIDAMTIDREMTWTGQFFDSFQIEDYEGNETSFKVHILHFLTMPWKVLFVFIPPRNYLNGYPSFFTLIIVIGAQVVLIEQLSALLGCTAGLEIAFTGLTLISIGTSIPDLFASRISAIKEDSADNCIGNVTGSNSVNIFLGLGLPWTISAIYAKICGLEYTVATDKMVETVFLYVLFACLAIGILILRRKYIGGELGGSRPFKYFSGLLIGFIWVIFVTICSLIIYNVINFKLMKTS